MSTKEQLQKDAQRAWAKCDEEAAIRYLKLHTPEGKKEREVVELKEKLESECSTDKTNALDKFVKE